ncbi:ATP-binding protein [Dyadobacter sp. 3J3]
MPKGRGTGLSYCRKIIRNHNGIIMAQSDSGKGTRFRIVLPVSRG